MEFIFLFTLFPYVYILMDLTILETLILFDRVHVIFNQILHVLADTARKAEEHF